jgi:hypothetical protein
MGEPRKIADSARVRAEPSALGNALNALAKYHATEALCDVHAALMDLESTPEEIEQMLCDVLFERIRVACAEWGPQFVADERVRSNLRRRFQKEAGIKSGKARAKGSRKERFLRWALERNASNPLLSKNAVAEEYAESHPGESVPTLRRYLAAIPVIEVD